MGKTFRGRPRQKSQRGGQSTVVVWRNAAAERGGRRTGAPPERASFTGSCWKSDERLEYLICHARVRERISQIVRD